MARSAVMLDMWCWRCALHTDHIETVPGLAYRCVSCNQLLDLTDPDVTALVSGGPDV